MVPSAVRLTWLPMEYSSWAEAKILRPEKFPPPLRVVREPLLQEVGVRRSKHRMEEPRLPLKRQTGKTYRFECALGSG